LGGGDNTVEGGREGNGLGGECVSSRNDIFTLIKDIDMTKEEINVKLQALRVQWKTADPSMRKVIEARAKLLRLALYKLEHKSGWFT